MNQVKRNQFDGEGFFSSLFFAFGISILLGLGINSLVLVIPFGYTAAVGIVAVALGLMGVLDDILLDEHILHKVLGHLHLLENQPKRIDNTQTKLCDN